MELDDELHGAVDLDVVQFAWGNDLNVPCPDRVSGRLVAQLGERRILEHEVELSR